MLALLLKGVSLGIVLSFIIGPLFFAIIQSALEGGFKAGLAVAVGIWASDVLFVVVVVRGLEAVAAAAASPAFHHWAGLAGGLMLVGFGVAGLLAKATAPPPLDGESPTQVAFERLGYLGLTAKGFFVNSLNPGTLVFWLGTATGVVIPNGWKTGEVALFFGAMLSVLALTDLAKIYAAKRLRRWLTPGHLLWLRRGVGAALTIFGVLLLSKSF